MTQQYLDSITIQMNAFFDRTHAANYDVGYNAALRAFDNYLFNKRNIDKTCVLEAKFTLDADPQYNSWRLITGQLVVDEGADTLTLYHGAFTAVRDTRYPSSNCLTPLYADCEYIPKGQRYGKPNKHYEGLQSVLWAADNLAVAHYVKLKQYPPTESGDTLTTEHQLVFYDLFDRRKRVVSLDDTIKDNLPNFLKFDRDRSGTPLTGTFKSIREVHAVSLREEDIQRNSMIGVDVAVDVFGSDNYHGEGRGYNLPPLYIWFEIKRDGTLKSVMLPRNDEVLVNHVKQIKSDQQWSRRTLSSDEVRKLYVLTPEKIAAQQELCYG